MPRKDDPYRGEAHPGNGHDLRVSTGPDAQPDQPALHDQRTATRDPATRGDPGRRDPGPATSEATLVIEGLPEATHTAVAAPAAPTAPPVHSHQRGHVKVKPTSALAARAAQEYVYVGEDLRHIAKVGITMLVLMIVLWLVIVVANVFGIY